MPNSGCHFGMVTKTLELVSGHQTILGPTNKLSGSWFGEPKWSTEKNLLFRPVSLCQIMTIWVLSLEWGLTAWTWVYQILVFFDDFGDKFAAQNRWKIPAGVWVELGCGGRARATSRTFAPPMMCSQHPHSTAWVRWTCPRSQPLPTAVVLPVACLHPVNLDQKSLNPDYLSPEFANQVCIESTL